jgi:hypothetical protein
MQKYISYAVFGAQKREKDTKWGPKNVFLQMGQHGYKKSVNLG